MANVKTFPHREAIQAMPLVAMALVVMLLGVLLWLLHRNEQDDEMRSLIQDALWVEQNLHFHVVSTEEKLGQLAAEIGRGGWSSDEFRTKASHIQNTNPELERVVFLDADKVQRASVPPSDSRGEAMAAGGRAGPVTFDLARSVGRVIYGPPYTLPGRGVVFEAHLPTYAGGSFTGMVVGVFSVEALLTHDVPWWFAEKYNLEIVDSGGTVLGSKSKSPLPDPGPSHQVRFEPPGHGLQIVATLYKSETNLARNALAAAIFGLALSALWSLWAVRRHIRRRQVAEQALREEHAFRKAMEDSLTVGMRARDLDGRITYVNPAFCNMVGWSADELVGIEPPMPYWLPEDLENTMRLHRQVLAGAAPPEGFELTFRRKNGEHFDALVYEAPLIDADGVHSGWMASVLDITERKRAQELWAQQQEKLQQTARLITMGEMASTLAHELNQPLSAIASYNTGCLNKLKSGRFDAAELEAALAKLGVQAQRAGQIIRRIHDFVRKNEPNASLCAINTVIEDSLGFIDADARKRGVAIDVRLAAGAPQVMADRILIEQVVLNLARNGIEAMSATPAAARRLSVAVERQDGQVLVRIADHGCGITPEVADKLFSPFFTTKEEGMGMGLNICRSIIEHHQGRLWFEPRPGGGSICQFTLPEAGLREVA